MSLYKKIFENKLQPPMVDPQADAQTFANGFEDEQSFQGLEQETQDITMTPEEIAQIVERGQKYKVKLDSVVSLLSTIQSDVRNGLFKSVQSKSLEKFAPIQQDLMELGIALTTGLNDKIIQNQSEDKKKSQQRL